MIINFIKGDLTEIVLYSLPILSLLLYYLRHIYRCIRYLFGKQHYHQPQHINFNQLKNNTKRHTGKKFENNEQICQNTDTLLAQFKLLQQENYDLTKINETANQNIKQLQIKNNELIQQNEKIIKDNEKLRKCCQKLQKNNEQIQNKLDESAKKCKALQKDKEDMRNNYQSLEKDFLDQNDENVSFTKLSDY